MSDTEATANGGTKSVSVSVTLNGKSLGVDAFIKLEQTHEFLEPVDDARALFRRQEIAEVLTEQALMIVKDATEQVTRYAAENPRGHVSVHTVQPAAAPAGVYAGQPATGAIPQQVVAVANGAVPPADGWATAVDRFDSTKQIRYLSSMVYPSDQLKGNVAQWLVTKGLDPQKFEVWDERTGKFGAESGHPISSVATVKIAEPYLNAVPGDVAYTAAGKAKGIARAKFNSDGSLYIWLDKQFEAALKYGACAVLSGTGAPAAPAAPAPAGEENPF